MEISEIRKEIDCIDDAMLDLFIRRMEFSGQLAQCKMQQNLP
ncbi:MAG: bifunctional chorismate mutase/prephenate dehydratase, partial [Actinobacteria bacterium]|nr:bifunctional chorismate mutase/prephenate dehydratase [Actinomycetota bacterium]